MRESLPKAQVSAQSGVQPGCRGLGSREQLTRARLSRPPTPERAGGLLQTSPGPSWAACPWGKGHTQPGAGVPSHPEKQQATGAAALRPRTGSLLPSQVRTGCFLRKPRGTCIDVECVCVCACVHVRV